MFFALLCVRIGVGVIKWVAKLRIFRERKFLCNSRAKLCFTALVGGVGRRIQTQKNAELLS